MASSLLLNGILMAHEHVGAAHNSTQIHTTVDNSNISPKNDQGAMMTMRYVAKELRGPGRVHTIYSSSLSSPYTTLSTEVQKSDNNLSRPRYT